MIFLKQNWSQSLEQEIERAQSEQVMISNNLMDNLDGINSRGAQINNQMLFDMIHSYNRYYEPKGNSLALWKNDTQLFPKILESEEIKKPDSLEVFDKDGHYVILVARNFPQPYDDFYFVYYRNIDFLQASQNKLNQLFIFVTLVSCIVLAPILYFVIRGLTKPLRILSRTSTKIAEGNYQERILVRGHDEFAEVANNFNVMANAIENHIDELALSAETKQRMIDNLAHELRTPLTAMQGFSETILTQNLNKKDENTAMQYINSETKRLKSLAFKLLDMAVLRQESLELQKISVDELFQRVQTQTLLSCQKKQIKLQHEINLKSIWGDEDLLATFLQNGVENACHASKVNNTIILKAYQQDDEAILEVCDFGKGMSAEQIKKVFEPFYRVDKSRSREHGGVGLGLSLCLQIAQIHGGSIEIKSEENKGSTLRLILQLHNNLIATL